jgi:hypothetical protein
MPEKIAACGSAYRGSAYTLKELPKAAIFFVAATMLP